MRTFASIDKMWTAALKDVMCGNRLDSRDGPCREVLGWSGTLFDTDRSFLSDSMRRLSPKYAAAELLWYASASASGAELLPYAPQYARFLAPDGTAYGAYGTRMMSQLPTALAALKKSPNTRQAVVTLWRQTDLDVAYSGTSLDIPCTVCLHFLLRNNQLYLVVYMRSNDLWLGFPYDVFAFTCIQRALAEELGVICGSYVHNVGSLHLYDRDAVKADHINKCADTPSHRWLTPTSNAFTVERLHQAGKKMLALRDNPDAWTRDLADGTMIGDLLTLVASHWTPVADPHTLVRSPALRLAYARTRIVKEEKKC